MAAVSTESYSLDHRGNSHFEWRLDDPLLVKNSNIAEKIPWQYQQNPWQLPVTTCDIAMKVQKKPVTIPSWTLCWSQVSVDLLLYSSWPSQTQIPLALVHKFLAISSWTPFSHLMFNGLSLVCISWTTYIVATSTHSCYVPITQSSHSLIYSTIFGFLNSVKHFFPITHISGSIFNRTLSLNVVSGTQYTLLSYDVASGSEITTCNKIDKPLVVYKF